MSAPLNNTEPIVPSSKETVLAGKSSRILSEYIKTTKTPTLQLVDKNKGGEKLVLPPQALQLLIDILDQMGQGNAVSLVSIHTES